MSMSKRFSEQSVTETNATPLSAHISKQYMTDQRIISVEKRTEIRMGLNCYASEHVERC